MGAIQQRGDVDHWTSSSSLIRNQTDHATLNAKRMIRNHSIAISPNALAPPLLSDRTHAEGLVTLRQTLFADCQ